MKITILSSGNLGLKTLINISEKLHIISVVTDSNSKDIIKWARNMNIPVFIGNPRNGKLSSFLSESAPDIILSINYLFLIEKDVIEIPQYAINFHGSLLPKYRGRTPHVWAIINGEKETGITAHLIDEKCDNGDIILQRKISIHPNQTGGEVLKQFELMYPSLVLEVVDLISSGQFTFVKQNEKEAAYFPKRVPEDGIIDWSWPAERIRNWVRALAFPYPGAFTFYDDQKVIIDKITVVDVDFKKYESKPNGYFYKDKEGSILVKCSDSLISLDHLRNEIFLDLEKDNFFNDGNR